MSVKYVSYHDVNDCPSIMWIYLYETILFLVVIIVGRLLMMNM